MSEVKIHIKTAHNWILREIGENIRERISGSTLSTSVDKSADINIFVNYALYQDVPGKTVSYFTHREEGSSSIFDNVARKSDLCLPMCEITRQAVVKANPSADIHIFKTGISGIYKPRVLNVGVIGRSYASGRKRFDWAKRIGEKERVNINFTGGKLAARDMPKFYRDQDYILVTSKIEGGPMCVPEAIACGRPLIVPRDVGWCNDFPALRFSTYEELEGIIDGLTYNHHTYDEQVKSLYKRLQKL